MQQHARHRASVISLVMVIHVVTPCAFLCLTGCQQYERKALDLTAHRESFDRRILNGSQLNDFLERLRQLNGDVPDKLSFDDGLTASEGEVVALFYNADLRQARLAAGIALADFDNAGLWDDPVFGFDGAEITSPSSPFQYGLTLSLTIPISGRLEIEKDRAGAAYEAELRRIVGAEWSTRTRVRSAWGAWTVAEEYVRLLREAIAQTEHVGSITDRLEAAGELSRVEGRLFRIEIADRRAALLAAEFHAQRARVDLLGLMGLPADADVDLIQSLPSSDQPATDNAIDRLIEANTELAVRRAEYTVAEDSLRLEIRRQYPDITIGAGYGSEENDDRLLLGVSVPIPVFNGNRAGIAEARAEREVARAAAEVTFERVARELAEAQAALDAVRAQRAMYESQIMPMLTEQAAEIERIAELGEVNMLLLLETVTRRFDAGSRLLGLQLEELNAAITITRLLGPDAATDPAPIGPGPIADTDEQQRAAGDTAGGVQ